MTKTPAQIKRRSNPGRRLELARRRSGYTRQDIAQRLKVPLPVIKYFDRWELDSVDEKYKTKQTIRRYALLVDLNPSDFEAEIPYSQPRQYSLKPMVVFSKLSLSTLAALSGLLIIGFLGWRTFVAAARPVLNISQPDVASITDQPTISVAGQTSEQAQVYVNGFNVPIDPNGHFSTSIILTEGANTITITAINSFGRQSESKRIVNYTP